MPTSKLAEATFDLKVHALLLLVGHLGPLHDVCHARCNSKGRPVLVLEPIKLIWQQHRLSQNASISKERGFGSQQSVPVNVRSFAGCSMDFEAARPEQRFSQP